MLCILHVVLLIPIAKGLWGPHALVSPSNFHLNNLWALPYTAEWYWGVLGLFVAILIYAIIKPYRVWPSIVLWLLGLSIFYRPSYMNTSGDHLAVIFLFFNMFILQKSKKVNQWTLIGIQAQLCIIYTVSAIFKLGSEQWIQGTAIANALTIPPFGYWSRETVNQLSVVLTGLTYITLIYQSIFSIAVWFEKIKKPLIIIGISMHLGIIFTLGLVEFGLIMTLGYVAFLPKEWVRIILKPFIKRV